MNPNTDKLIRRSTMVGTAVAAYFLVTADYGPQPNVLDPIKNTILSGQRSVIDFITGSRKRPEGSDHEKVDAKNAKGTP